MILDRFNWRTISDPKHKYAAYLASREWAEKRRAVLTRSNGLCERCGVNAADSVHHLNYLRKYDEALEDLAAICNGCHEFTHGKSDVDPRASGPLYLRDLHIKVRSIYLAGSCYGAQYDEDGLNWRHRITSAYAMNWGDDPPEVAAGAIVVHGKKADYRGPFLLYDHGGKVNPHGACGELEQEVFARAVEGIAGSSLVFAWIDRTDCYGTMVELGMAHSLCRPVVVAGPKKYEDMWFAYQTSGEPFNVGECPRKVLESVLR